MNKLCWITPNYFLDTDVYIMRYLPDYFDVKWIITKKVGEPLDFQSLIADIERKQNVSVEVFELDGKRYGIKGLLYELLLARKIKTTHFR